MLNDRESQSSEPLSADIATSSILKAAAVPTVVVAILGVILGFLLRGGPGLIGALVGGVVACAFFIGGQLAVTKILENNPQTAMTGAGACVSASFKPGTARIGSMLK